MQFQRWHWAPFWDCRYPQLVLKFATDGESELKSDPLVPTTANMINYLRWRLPPLPLLLELCIQFLWFFKVRKGLENIKPGVQNWSNIFELSKHLMNSGSDCAEELRTCLQWFGTQVDGPVGRGHLRGLAQTTFDHRSHWINISLQVLRAFCF